jgi:hypothetical protein
MRRIQGPHGLTYRNPTSAADSSGSVENTLVSRAIIMPERGNTQFSGAKASTGARPRWLKLAGGVLILIISEAFLGRPRLVEGAPGFLGMEVLVDRSDPALFHLVTRWTDESSFERWHGGPLHKQAHRGIPKGLKLDPSFTAIRRYNLLPDGPAQVENLNPLVGNLPALVARSSSIHWLRAAREGRIFAANSRLITEARSLPGRKMRFISGGSAFRRVPGFWRELGATGVAFDVREALKLAGTL